MSYDLLIRGGRVVMEGQVRDMDVAVRDEKIARLDGNIDAPAREVVDATGKYILPGAIDSHTHFHLPIKDIHTSDDFRSGTVAAACGGVTTVIDFALHQRGGSLKRAIENRRAEADVAVAVDYALHAEVVEANQRILDEIPWAIKEGICSFKIYMAYRREGRQLDDGEIYAVMRRCATENGVVMVHAENGDLLDRLVAELLREGKTAPRYHPLSRPPLLEVEAVGRALKIAELSRAPLYIAHLTTEGGMHSLPGSSPGGFDVWAETCPHYLLLNEDVYRRDDGLDFIASPPLRRDTDREALWTGLAGGVISTVATDHCPFTRRQKRAYGLSFHQVPNGLPGVETLLSLMHSEGVVAERIPLVRMVELLSTNPAKIFGLFPRKGIIAEGSDADLVIFDPHAEAILSSHRMHMNVDFSPFEGLRVHGYPVATVLRGEVIVRNGFFCGRRGRGKFVEGRRGC